jgi:hypothetical protein
MKIFEIIKESPDLSEYNKGNNWGLSERDAEEIISYIQDGEDYNRLTDYYPGLENFINDHEEFYGSYYWDYVIDSLKNIEDGGMELDD